MKFQKEDELREKAKGILYQVVDNDSWANVCYTHRIGNGLSGGGYKICLNKKLPQELQDKLFVKEIGHILLQHYAKRQTLDYILSAPKIKSVYEKLKPLFDEPVNDVDNMYQIFEDYVFKTIRDWECLTKYFTEEEVRFMDSLYPAECCTDGTPVYHILPQDVGYPQGLTANEYLLLILRDPKDWFINQAQAMSNLENSMKRNQNGNNMGTNTNQQTSSGSQDYDEADRNHNKDPNAKKPENRKQPQNNQGQGQGQQNQQQNQQQQQNGSQSSSQNESKKTKDQKWEDGKQQSGGSSGSSGQQGKQKQEQNNQDQKGGGSSSEGDEQKQEKQGQGSSGDSSSKDSEQKDQDQSGGDSSSEGDEQKQEQNNQDQKGGGSSSKDSEQKDQDQDQKGGGKGDEQKDQDQDQDGDGKGEGEENQDGEDGSSNGEDGESKNQEWKDGDSSGDENQDGESGDSGEGFDGNASDKNKPISEMSIDELKEYLKDEISKLTKKILSAQEKDAEIDAEENKQLDAGYGRGGGGSGSVLKSSCSNWDDFDGLEKKIKELLINRLQAKTRRDLLHNYNRGKTSGNVLTPKIKKKVSYRESPLTVILDVSGSISQKNILGFVNIFKNVSNEIDQKCTIVLWDTDLRAIFNTNDEIQAVSGGGTDIGKGIEWVKKHLPPKDIENIFIVSDFEDEIVDWNLNGLNTVYGVCWSSTDIIKRYAGSFYSQFMEQFEQMLVKSELSNDD